MQGGKKLGILLGAHPRKPGFAHGVAIAAAALDASVDVYLYCLDEAVLGVDHPDLQSLRLRGLKLYACAYGAHRHGVPLSDMAVFAGLTVVSDLMAATDRFLSINE